MKRGWALLIGLFFLLSLSSLTSAELTSGCSPSTCSGHQACGNCGVQQKGCDASGQCVWGACQEPPNACTPTDTVPCTDPNYQQICTSSCTYSSCVCITGSVDTSDCNPGYVRACQGSGTNTYWGTCQYDCRGVTCTSTTPPECRTTAGAYCDSKRQGCVYPTLAAKGTDCGSADKVCDVDGTCSLPRCSSPSFCSSSTSLTGVTANGNWCDKIGTTSRTCYTCTIGRWDGTTCVQNL